MQASKGYLDIDTNEYDNYMLGINGNARVKMTDPSIRQHLEDDGSGSLPLPGGSQQAAVPQPKKVPHPILVKPPEKPKKVPHLVVGDLALVCVDNTGIEDHFDQGIEYVIENHPDPQMIYAYDKQGEKGEYLVDRFAVLVVNK